MGLFDDLFGNDKKKSQQAFGLFSFMNNQQEDNNNEQQEDNNSEYSDEELDNYGLEDWQKEEKTIINIYNEKNDLELNMR